MSLAIASARTEEGSSSSGMMSYPLRVQLGRPWFAAHLGKNYIILKKID
jgi:hypothetical protein